MSRRKRIGIMGGTFDPVHMVHLTLAENAYHSFGLDEVLMLPNGDPPDIRFLNIPDLALSSSEIRHRVREHQSIRFMVPEGVREYIEEHQLYCR